MKRLAVILGPGGFVNRHFSISRCVPCWLNLLKPVAFAAFVIVICSNWNLIRSQVINYKTTGQNFSPYIDGQDPNLRSQISEQQLRTRMQIVAPYTQWIRTFGTTDGLEKAGLVARSLGLKAAIGAWLGRDLAANEQQVTNLINICLAGQCDLAIVGSEVLLRGDLSETQLIDYIKRVRQALPANIPVTTADTYLEFLKHPNVIANIDLVMANFYPYWEGTRVDLAMAALHVRYADVKAAAGGKQVFVSETGWPSAGDQIGAAVPSSQNASFYFLNFVSWARANNVQYFYFESFDESWKAKYEGPQGAHWGIWDKDGSLKPGMQDVFDGKTMPDNWSGGVVACNPDSPKLRFTSVPPLGSFDNLFGQVCGVTPADYRIVVYIRVGSGWWVKPFAIQPLTTILNDGSWSTDITTGGIDQTAIEIVAYLVPKTFSPPILLGSPTLPDTLALNSIAKAEALRCSYAITPTTSDPFPSTGGTGKVSVTTPDKRCSWSSVSNDDWIVITSGSGSGNGTVSFSVTANNNAAPRIGTLTIAGKTFTVRQTGTGISCGQALTSSIQAGQSQSYTFSGDAGERVRVVVSELQPTLANLSLRLNSSSGTLVAQASGKPAVIGNVGLPATGTYTIVISAVVAPTIYKVELFCSPASRIPILISEETSTRAIALDSVLQLRDPFSPTSPVPWGADRRTRIMIFAFNLELLPGENLSILTADAEDASRRVYPLTIEYVAKVPGFDWLNCLVVRLHDGMGDIGDVLVRVTARGFPSNRVRVGIGHRGGGPPDDPGAIPTPGRIPQ